MANWSKSMGPNFVPAYQLSGIPYVTSSAAGMNEERIDFPQATRFVVIQNHGRDAGNATGASNLRVGFTAHGVNVHGSSGKNYFTLPVSSSTGRLELRCKTLFIRADDVDEGTKIRFDVLAGLSAVDAGQFPILTGTMALTGSDGEPLSKPVPRFKGVG
tara:strand:+ start:200 stop:676 length:477 start_codon:yes stop_codon:yes gene_type:complete